MEESVPGAWALAGVLRPAVKNKKNRRSGGVLNDRGDKQTVQDEDQIVQIGPASVTEAQA